MMVYRGTIIIMYVYASMSLCEWGSMYVALGGTEAALPLFNAINNCLNP